MLLSVYARDVLHDDKELCICTGLMCVSLLSISLLRPLRLLMSFSLLI